jgi:DNA-binding NarL/FixJ family response regulator
MGKRADRERTRVAVVDGHELFRNGLVELLGDSGYDVVATAGTLEEALEAIPRTAPHVVVVGLGLHPISELEAIRALAMAAPTAGLLVLAVDARIEHLVAAVRAGAGGYVLKAAGGEEIVDAADALADGGAAVSPALLKPLLEAVRAAPGLLPSVDGADHGLSGREVATLRLLVRGLGNADIAAELMVSADTAKHHVSAILAKTGTRNRVEAAAWAVANGIV